MLSFYLAIAAVAWLIEAADDNPSRTPHAVVAFIHTGERKPQIMGGAAKLTAVGVEQMHTLGQQFRGRYIGGRAYTGLGHEPLPGMAVNVLHSEQLFIQTLVRDRKSTRLNSSHWE